ncbi:TonB-dependent receptor [uncultured Mucilaginibacter sp.]|uniref:TonB-dependent receptor n=1 Tax=uncultured Mucilaginibacter sp. TaxID=797541 RepID=UPI0025E2BE3E|nr:TonB-dependent receptor [uncultured Mucilaginibacter sp.]
MAFKQTGRSCIRLWLAFVCLMLLLTNTPLFAQSRFTISGTVKDTLTGETLIGATVRITGPVKKGATTNTYGFYSLTVPKGQDTLSFSYVGYKTIIIRLLVTKNTTLNIDLGASNALNEVVVTDKAASNNNILEPQMGVNKLDIKEISNVPVLLGEKDVIKTIELLPGIETTGDANTGFYVRGGGSDENLILLDGAPVYNASHLFGFFSTFNSDAIKDITLYKGGMPAEYGSRMSSVLDIKMDEGNNKQYTAEGGIGLIASRLKLEGPIVKDKGSFMISARRTYADVFLKLSSDSTLNSASLYFYDINFKANYRLNDKNGIYLSGYFGQDDIGLKNNFSTAWGNTTGTLRWNHLFSGKLFSNTSLIYSNYNYTIQNFDKNSNFQVVSKIEDVNLKEDFEYYLGGNQSLRFGVSAVHHTIEPGDISSSSTSSFNPQTIENRYAYEFAAYISDNWKPTDKLNIVYGLRFNQFLLIGPGTFDTYDSNGNAITGTTYGSGQTVAHYFNVEPRFSASYTLNDQTSLKAAYNLNTQNIHLLSNSTSSLPTDLYVMSSNNIKPGISNQVSLGYYRNFDHDNFEFSTEVYYKWLSNEIDYRDNAQLVANQNVESQLLFGVGRAYGIEFFLKKKYGRYNGWIGYTLSRTERKFDGINNDTYFPARQDRTHDISFVNMFNATKRWSFSAVFVFGTGNAVTYPAGKYQIGGITTYYYTNRNGSRLPDNSRLDLGATLEGKPHKSYHSSWTFSIYNAYNRKNPYSVVFQNTDTSPVHTEAVETSLFGIIPSVTWNFKFR